MSFWRSEDMAMIIYGACIGLGESESSASEAAFSEFAAVCSKAPLEVQWEVRMVSDCSGLPEIADALTGDCYWGIHKALCDWLEATAPGGQSIHHNPWADRRIIVRCPHLHPAKQKCLAEAPHAVWGATSSPVAIVYGAPDKFIIWHEMFHLIGAEDCYCVNDAIRDLTCGFHGCIMQYAPTAESVRKWPFVCNANVQRIRQHLAPREQDETQ